MFPVGLWSGKRKPQFPSFFHPFVDEMKRLYDVGFEWNSSGKLHKSTVTVLSCSCDSVPRCALQNISQFNGSYGFTWCLHPCETTETQKQTRVHVYPEP